MDLPAILAFWGLHDQPQAGRAEHQCRARNSSHSPLMCCCLPTRAQAGGAFLALKLSDHQQWWWRWWWSWWACGGHFQSSLVRLEPRDVGQVDRQHNSAPRHSYTHAHTCRSLLLLFVCFKTSLSANILLSLKYAKNGCPCQGVFFLQMSLFILYHLSTTQWSVSSWSDYQNNHFGHANGPIVAFTIAFAEQKR